MLTCAWLFGVSDATGTGSHTCIVQFRIHMCQVSSTGCCGSMLLVLSAWHIGHCNGSVTVYSSTLVCSWTTPTSRCDPLIQHRRSRVRFKVSTLSSPVALHFWPCSSLCYFSTAYCALMHQNVCQCNSTMLQHLSVSRNHARSMSLI